MLSHGKKLAQLRKSTGFTQTQVCSYMNFDQSYLSKIEKDERSLSIEQLERLLELYGQDLSYLSTDIAPEKMNMAFRATELSVDDMESLAVMNRLGSNLRFMLSLKESD